MCADFEVVSKMAVMLFQTEKQSKKRLTRTACACMLVNSGLCITLSGINDWCKCWFVASAACGWDQQVMEEIVLAIAKILIDAAKVANL